MWPTTARSITEPRLVSAGRTGTGGSFIKAAATVRTDLTDRPSGRSEVILSTIHFAVIGAGRLGLSLALALRAQGSELTGFVCATPEGGARAQALLDMPPASTLDSLVATQPTHYLITVPDGSLPDVAAALGAALPDMDHGASTPPYVLHTSGVTSVSILSPCAAKGACVFAFHPLQTFSEPLSGATRFPGSAVAITPSEGPAADQARQAGFALARGLGALPFLLADNKRALYHAAAVMACNYLVTLEHCAENLFVQSGMAAEQALPLFIPLVRATLDNVAAHGAIAALTGPLSRGDEATISMHLAIMERDAPELLPLYRRLGLHTLDLVRVRGDVQPAILERLTHLLTT